MKGLVSLVGAGPGDPELLTLRAVERLRAADLVLYDALVDRFSLRHAPQARWAYVGKRSGRHSISQQTIERVMIRRALAGERVVRLKSGDPFVFGRGGEEAEALVAARGRGYDSVRHLRLASGLGLAGPLDPYLLTNQFEAWLNLARDPIAWEPIARCLWVSLLWGTSFLAAAWAIFTRRDVLS
jgi:hypothetical protein